MKYGLLLWMLSYSLLGFAQEKTLDFNRYTDLANFFDILMDNLQTQSIDLESMDIDNLDVRSFVVYTNDGSKTLFLNDTIQIYRAIDDKEIEYNFICHNDTEHVYLIEYFFIGKVILNKNQLDYQVIGSSHPEFENAQRSFDRIIDDIVIELLKNQFIAEIIKNKTPWRRFWYTSLCFQR